MIKQRLEELGYDYKPSPIKILTFHSATRVGDLVFTSGQIPMLGDRQVKGNVGGDITLEEASIAAEICAYNCICAAGAVVDVEEITQVVKILGLVNFADGFDQFSEVINGATEFMTSVFGENGYHARSAVGARLPGNWAVEVEAIFQVQGS